MKCPNSFVIFGRGGRKYRVFFHKFTGYWFVAYNDGQKRKRSSLNVKTKAEAEAAVRQLEAPAAPAKVAQRITWADFQKKYLAFKQDTGKAPKTVTRYRAAMEAFGRYLKSIGTSFADEVTLSILEGYIPYRTKTEKCDVKTGYADALTIKNALKWASKASRGLLPVNPSTDWETPEPVKPKRRMYTPDEVARLENEVRGWLRPVVTTLAWSGMRIGELVNLRWLDADFKEHVLHIRIRDDWKPKGRRDRTVPMHPKVEAALSGQRIGQYVFCGKRGGRLKETWCLSSLKKDQDKLKMARGDLHGFRRFFATTMMKAGVPVETVRQWGGWQSLETMLRYLADVDVKDSVKAMELAAKKLAAIN